jgi:hypothetical protein
MFPPRVKDETRSRLDGRAEVHRLDERLETVNATGNCTSVRRIEVFMLECQRNTVIPELRQDRQRVGKCVVRKAIRVVA